MMEIFKIGEKIRLLHAKGEGMVTRLISPTRLEVLIDDFYEMEVSVGEVVKINSAENVLRASGSAGDLEGSTAQRKGTGISPSLAPAPDLPPSLVVFKNSADDYELWLLNQGRNEVLYTCFIRVGNKFVSFHLGSAMPRNNQRIGTQTTSEFHMSRSILLQVLQFPRVEHPKPIAPITLEVSCKTGIFVKAPAAVPELNVQGWEFVIQEKVEAPAQTESTGGARLVQQKPAKPPQVVDLHIHKIMPNPLGIDSATMLRIQLETFEKAVTDAQAHHMDSIVFIHGIGNGTLKKEIHHRLGHFDFVKHYQLAEPMEYGNGATIVYFKGGE
jgi:Smr domain